MDQLIELIKKTKEPWNMEQLIELIRETKDQCNMDQLNELIELIKKTKEEWYLDNFIRQNNNLYQLSNQQKHKNHQYMNENAKIQFKNQYKFAYPLMFNFDLGQFEHSAIYFARKTFGEFPTLFGTNAIDMFFTKRKDDLLNTHLVKHCCWNNNYFEILNEQSSLIHYVLDLSKIKLHEKYIFNYSGKHCIAPNTTHNRYH